MDDYVWRAEELQLILTQLSHMIELLEYRATNVERIHGITPTLLADVVGEITQQCDDLRALRDELRPMYQSLTAPVAHAN